MSPVFAHDLAGDVAEAPASLRSPVAAEAARDYLHDESKLAATAIGSLAVPETTDALRQVMRWHAQERHAVTLSASRTGVAGGAVPADGSHVVSLSALRGVVQVDPEGATPVAKVLAGTWLSDLTQHLARHHPEVTFPVDPTETSASIGGMVATNAGGARSFRFGSMREWVEGLTVELASGNTLTLRRGVDRATGGMVELVDGGVRRTLQIGTIPKPATKHAIGYGFAPDGDILDLFVGAEGTLGAISTVTVRLLREPGARLGVLQFFPTVGQAFAYVDAIRRSPAIRTTALEFLDARSHALARESGSPAAERVLRLAGADDCSVFTEVMYDGDAALAHTLGVIEAAVQGAGGVPEASLAGATEDELRDIRAFRHAVPERVNATIAARREAVPALHKIATDMAVPDADLAWVHAQYHRRLAAAGLDFAVFGHVGNNHFHVNILPRTEEELVRARGIYAELAREVVARGGSVAAEHGIGRIKKAFLAIQYAPEILDAMRAVKRWADPGWRLNRGVLLDP